jgi:hypothetical protein
MYKIKNTKSRKKVPFISLGKNASLKFCSDGSRSRDYAPYTQGRKVRFMIFNVGCTLVGPGTSMNLDNREDKK